MQPLLAERIPFEITNEGEIVLNSVSCIYSDARCAIFSWDAHSKYYDVDYSTLYDGKNQNVRVDVMLSPREHTLKTRTPNLNLKKLDYTKQTTIGFEVPCRDMGQYHVFLGSYSCRYGGTICFVVPDSFASKPDLSKFIWMEGDD